MSHILVSMQLQWLSDQTQTANSRSNS